MSDLLERVAGAPITKAGSLIDDRADVAAVGVTTWDAIQAGRFAPESLEVVWSSPHYCHCNFTVLGEAANPRFTRWTDTLLVMDYNKPAERKILEMFRSFRLSGQTFFLPPGTPRDRVETLREAMRKTFQDPDFAAEYRKLVGDDPTPVMPEALEKAIKELPRESEIIEIFNKLGAAGPLPAR